MATSVVSIRELGGQRRQLDLIGAGLPFNGAAWGGELKQDTNFNPGNPEGVTHVLGPREAPSQWEGEWNTTRLVAAPPLYSVAGGSPVKVSFASDLRDVFESIIRSGQRLVVTWIADDNRRITRFGRVGPYDFKHRGAHDIKWSATFIWQGRNENTSTPSFAGSLLAEARASTLAATNAAGYQDAQQIVSANQAVPGGASRFTLGQLEALADAPRAFLSQFSRLAQAVSSRLKQLTNVITTARGQPAAIGSLAVDAANDAVAVANNFIDTMSRTPPETLSLNHDVASLLRAASYYNGAITQAQLMAATNGQFARLARQRRALARNSAGNISIASSADVITTYLAKSGETMLSISRKFYGGDDLSFWLSRANGLPGQTIQPPRFALVIPQRAVLDQLRQRGS